MTRLYVVVEGQTEEAFVEALLRPHLATRQIFARPIVVATSRASGGNKRKGGGYWRHWKADLSKVVAEQAPSGGWVTTMFDLYGLPEDYPNLEEIARATTPAVKVALAEAALAQAFLEIKSSWRLIPYVQCHEFEALVLASLDGLHGVLDAPEDLQGLERLRAELGDVPPELVNDGPDTAPSKRLKRHIPGYEKVLHGELALLGTTLPALMTRCPHFGTWIRRLERLGVASDDGAGTG